MHTCRLFYAVKPVDKDINRAEQKMRNHLARKPCQVRAHNIFYKEAMSFLRQGAGRAGKVGPLTQRESQERLAQTQRKFKTLPSHHRLVVKCQSIALLDGVQEAAGKVSADGRGLETARVRQVQEKV